MKKISPTRKPRVFLAAPFRSKINNKSNTVKKSYQRFLTTIIEWLESKDFTVYSAHKREHWGSKKFSISNIMNTDYESLKFSDIYLAHVDKSKTIGVLIEIGWATAFQKPIIIFSKTALPPFITGSKHINKNLYLIRYKNNDELFQKINSVFSSKLKIQSK